MILDEVLAKLAEIKSTFGYDFKWLNIYGEADFRRNEFIWAARKAIREVIREHEPYAIPSLKTTLAAMLSRAVMRLWLYPSQKDSLAQQIEDVYNYAKYGVSSS